jgi:hypothetical protein
VTQSISDVVASPRNAETLEAMARMARQTGSVVHVVVKREPGIVENARVVANHAGVEVSIDLMACTVRARFDGR